MLSFMQNGDTNLKTTDSQLPNDTGIITDGQNDIREEYLLPAEHGKNLKHSTMVLIGLFVIGAACVWVMVKKSIPAPAGAAQSTEEAKIEQAIAQITGIKSEMNTTMEDMVGKFYQSEDIGQIGVSELRKNPFKLDMAVGTGVNTGTNEKELDLARKALLREQINKQSKELQLWSIMESPRGNCCMINDKILYPGSIINNFKVEKINSDSVELSCDFNTVILKMSE